MLDKFLEPNIQSKLQILYTLQTRGTCSIRELSHLLHISSTNASDLLSELNYVLTNQAKINKTPSALSLTIYDGVDFFDLLLTIYQQSDTLQCLKFLLLNDSQDAFSTFMDTHFMTKSTAYRIRQKCIDYLALVGLDVVRNKVVGEEYRIRYLIALLYYKYGVDFDYFNISTMTIAREFVLSTNDVIDMDFLEYTDNEYGYFECLLILSWKRKPYPLHFSANKELDNLKPLFIYDKIKDISNQTLAPKVGVSFDENDHTYLFLAYCSSNSCFLSDKWSLPDVIFVHDVVFSQPAFSDLLKRFSNQFGDYLESFYPLRSVLVYFYKKCLYDLQCLIPDKHFYLDALRNPSTRIAVQHIKELLNTWKNDYGRIYPLDENHLTYLSLQIDIILRQHAKPVPLVIAADTVSELTIMKIHFSHTFSPERVSFHLLLLNAQNPNILREESNCVIVVNHSFKNVIRDLYLTEENPSHIIVPVSTELTAYDMDSVYHAIKEQDDKNHLLLFSY